MSTYAKPKPDVLVRLINVMRRYHGALADAEIAVQVLMVSPNLDANGDPTGPALRVHGYAAAACIRVLSLRDRVARCADAEMLIDADHWDEASEAERDALLDHELTHLALITDGDGKIRRDDADRPRLGVRKHDRQFGWFDAVAGRHREHSIEVRQARDMLDSLTFRQCYLFDVEPKPCAPKTRRHAKAPTEQANVLCADGRKITPSHMMREAKQLLNSQ